MTGYIVRRLGQALVTLLVVSVFVFAIMRLTPGDPARAMLGNEFGVTPEMIETVRREMGLDRPLHVQYLSWLGDLARGDFGHSYISKAQVSDLIRQRLPASVELAVAATVLALLLAVPAGVLAAVWRGSWADHLIRAFVTAGIAMPGFWLAILIVLLCSVVLRWLPPSGYVPFEKSPGDNLRLLILPSITLAILIAAPTMRFLRSSMLETLGLDFIRTARAKGLTEAVLVRRHALQNALIPTITWVGLQFAALVGGSVMVEWVFGWPGIGWMAIKAVLSRDYLVVQGTVVLIAAIFVGINLVVDVLYGVVDPRVRLAQ